MVNIDTIRFAVTLAVLMVACYYDVKFRKIPHQIWYVLMGAGIVLNVLSFNGTFDLVNVGIGIGTIIGTLVILEVMYGQIPLYDDIVDILDVLTGTKKERKEHRLPWKLMGGADTTAILSIAIMYPLNPGLFSTMPFMPLLPFFGMSVLLNALLISVPAGLKAQQELKQHKKFNAQQAVPFLVYITIGYVLAIAGGDIVLMIFSTFMSAVTGGSIHM